MPCPETRPTFAALLRSARLAAGLTQAEPAAPSGLSVRGLSDLERGERRAPHRETPESLIRVLCLTESERCVWEHGDMYGAILTPPVTLEADYGILFMHNEGYSTMCGHGIIAVTTILVETGQVAADGPTVAIGYDTPAGFVRAQATVDAGRVTQVPFENVPSFVYTNAVSVEASFGAFDVPVVFGGAFYALAPVPMGMPVEPDDAIGDGFLVR